MTLTILLERMLCGYTLSTQPVRRGKEERGRKKRGGRGSRERKEKKEKEGRQREREGKIPVYNTQYLLCIKRVKHRSKHFMYIN